MTYVAFSGGLAAGLALVVVVMAPLVETAARVIGI